MTAASKSDFVLKYLCSAIRGSSAVNVSYGVASLSEVLMVFLKSSNLQ